MLAFMSIRSRSCQHASSFVSRPRWRPYRHRPALMPAYDGFAPAHWRSYAFMAYYSLVIYKNVSIR
ncbi:hypothetical protein COLSTE_00681 [Collinsella stercoris DSM 13279]|uniref:Uncharacterized protein n=1 Tax=Collinsella stercoris DSM 13279 TaxID=445975 RepID=B6G9E0_9ACTN|nr:hypothetical protein COLSTE_00681 [Collinsella stercoris DSM 13279]